MGPDINSLDNKLFVQLEKSLGKINENQQIYHKLLFDATSEALVEIKTKLDSSLIYQKNDLIYLIQQKVVGWQQGLFYFHCYLC